MRKLTLAMMLMLGAWYSAFALAPSAGGEEKAMKGRETEAVATMATPAAAMPAEELIGQPGSAHQVNNAAKQDDATAGNTGAKAVQSPKMPESAAATSTTRKDVRNAMKDLRKENRGKDAPAAPSADDMLIICVILCFFIPPLAVYLWENSIGINFWISLILTLLFWVPGVIFSLIVVLTT